MLMLWQCMTDLYGHKWLSAYGPATETSRERTGEKHTVLSPTVNSWRRALKDITAEEIALGVSRCVSMREEWPPSAPQFRDRCRPNREPYDRPEFQQRALPKPRDPEVGRKALKDIKQRLGMAS